MKIYLKANERIFVNGAVLRFDRKVTLELMNDATFLLESHVMQKEDATTPLRQLYFVVQLMLIDPGAREQAMTLLRDMMTNLFETIETPSLLQGLKAVDEEVSTGKEFQALKTIRALLPLEEDVIGTDQQSPAYHEPEEMRMSAGQAR